MATLTRNPAILAGLGFALVVLAMIFLVPRRDLGLDERLHAIPEIRLALAQREVHRIPPQPGRSLAVRSAA